jgi:16S rRNA G966 N2-methylase RsmD
MDIYNRFKPTSILDFTMGWGGRLVGACAMDIPSYIGIDLNKNLIKPYEEMVKTLKELGTKTEIKLIFKDALKVDYSKLNYDCVFTSPPYYNIELYTGTKASHLFLPAFSYNFHVPKPWMT